MKPDVSLAIESMIKYVLYLNIFFLLLFFVWIENFKLFSMIILITNLILLGLRQGIKNKVNEINYRSS